MNTRIISGFAQHTPRELIAKTGKTLEARGVHSDWALEQKADRLSERVRLAEEP